jgi:flagellar biosynthesis/type III secretory pathway M-ring protein FliF/YscJ
MRTVDRLASTAALSWLRAQADRVRRALLARRPAVLVGLVLAVASGLAAVGYWTAMALVPVSTRYLASGRSFSSEDLNKVRRALDAKGIEYHIDGRKVEVSADQFDQAAAIFAKLDVGPHSFEEILNPSDSWSSWFQSPEERHRKQLLSRERMLAAFLNDLDGVVWSLVTIEYPRAKMAWHSRAKPSAFVYVET